MLKRAAMAPAILLLLLASSCTDSDLATVSKSLLVAAKSIGTVQDTVIQAEKLGVIPTETTRTILEACVKANYAGQQASAITRSISKLDPASRAQMTPMVSAALQSINASLVIDLSGVKDDQTKLMITAGLGAAKTALITALTLLQSGG